MKRKTPLLLVAILLTACQPAAPPHPTALPLTELPALTSTPAPVETLAGSADDLVGIWMFSVKLEIKADGKFRLYFGSDTSPELIDEGTYAFDAGKITWIAGSACKRAATYEAYLTREEGKPAWLRLQVVGSDSCKDRADMFARPGKFLVPSIAVVDPLVTQIAGKYLTTITMEESKTQPDIEPGAYLLKLQSDMRWFVMDLQGTVLVQGYYTISAEQIVLETRSGPAAGACIGTFGSYAWNLDGETLTLTAIKDDCPGGKFFLTVHPFIHQP